MLVCTIPRYNYRSGIPDAPPELKPPRVSTRLEGAETLEPRLTDPDGRERVMLAAACSTETIDRFNIGRSIRTEMRKKNSKYVNIIAKVKLS